MSLSEVFVDFVVNPQHVVLLLLFSYGAFLFFKDHVAGENGVTLGIALFLASLALGEVWSITFLWIIHNVDLARYARGVQLAIVITAIINLVYQYICYQQKIKNGELQSKNNSKHKKGC